MPAFLLVLVFSLCVSSIEHSRHWLSMSEINEIEKPANDILSLAREIQKYCSSHYGLKDYQIKLCRQNPSHIRVLVEAAKLALKECQRIFANDRWQCIPEKNHNSSFLMVENSLFSYVLSYANRETAFLNALSAAALHHQLAGDCKRGKLPRDCGCSLGPPPDYMEGWMWKGCGDNIEYGEDFSRLFTVIKNNEIISKYNSAVGIQIVKKMTLIKCTCYEADNNCEAKTCWQKLSPFDLVADHIRELFNSAIQVVAVDGKVKPQFPTDTLNRDTLIYSVSSPSFCEHFKEYGIAGTRGRECNPKNESKNYLPSCDELCCGRGIVRRELITVENCNCKFIWCCRVECDSCEKRRVVYYCN